MATKRSKWIVPPGLVKSFDVFKAHYAVSEGEPILIVGDSGVGKSLFLHQFEVLFKKDHPDKPIIKINCSHFDGADPNVARSELFGHEKGAFTGAQATKQGLISQANGGALILEEVGDLPKPTQAMLLDFLETGEYRKIGGNKVESVRIQVVGATNKPEELRGDLLHRFSPFRVPALRERRLDVLVYLMKEEAVDFLRSLKPWEILLLLCHDWPWNIRAEVSHTFLRRSKATIH